MLAPLSLCRCLPPPLQLWFPSSLSEPLTPSRSLSLASPLAIASPTATGLAAAAAAASTNSTDPELEFDREVYPIGVSLAEVSIVGAPGLGCSLLLGRSCTG